MEVILQRREEWSPPTAINLRSRKLVDLPVPVFGLELHLRCLHPTFLTRLDPNLLSEPLDQRTHVSKAILPVRLIELVDSCLDLCLASAKLEIRIWIDHQRRIPRPARLPHRSAFLDDQEAN